VQTYIQLNSRKYMIILPFLISTLKRFLSDILMQKFEHSQVPDKDELISDREVTWEFICP